MKEKVKRAHEYVRGVEREIEPVTIAGASLEEKSCARFNKQGTLTYISEIVQLIEITPFLVEHVSCSPDGIMECWNTGMLV